MKTLRVPSPLIKHTGHRDSEEEKGQVQDRLVAESRARDFYQDTFLDFLKNFQGG